MEKDNLEILLEDIRGKFDLVLKGHDVLRKEIEDTRHELCEKISLVDFKVGALTERVDGLSERVDGVDEKVGALREQVDGVEAKLTQKLDAVAADLKEHRADTEVHKVIYKVKETDL